MATSGGVRRGRSRPGDGLRQRVRRDRPHADAPGGASAPLVDLRHIGAPSQSARIFITSKGKLLGIPIFRSANAARNLVRQRPDADDRGPGADRWLLLALMAWQ